MDCVEDFAPNMAVHCDSALNTHIGLVSGNIGLFCRSIWLSYGNTGLFRHKKGIHK